MNVEFRILGQDGAYDDADMVAVPRQGDRVFLGEESATVYSVINVLWDPHYSDGFNASGSGRAVVFMEALETS